MCAAMRVLAHNVRSAQGNPIPLYDQLYARWVATIPMTPTSPPAPPAPTVQRLSLDYVQPDQTTYQGGTALTVFGARFSPYCAAWIAGALACTNCAQQPQGSRNSFVVQSPSLRASNASGLSGYQRLTVANPPAFNNLSTSPPEPGPMADPSNFASAQVNATQDFVSRALVYFLPPEVITSNCVDPGAKSHTGNCG